MEELTPLDAEELAQELCVGSFKGLLKRDTIFYEGSIRDLGV